MIIAESGTAWAHDDRYIRMSRLLQYLDAAAAAGADYFKVQMFAPDEPLFCPFPGDEKRWLRWKNSCFQFDEWRGIKQVCERAGIGFMASAFQYTTVQWLNRLEVDYYKVASRAVETYPYERCPDQFIVSNGMGMKWPAVPHKKLQCVSKYPTPLSDARWTIFGGHGSDYMTDVGPEFTYDGLSDHSGMPWPTIDALANDAEIVEVHFKLDDEGPDAASSVTVEELKMICDFQKALNEMRG